MKQTLLIVFFSFFTFVAFSHNVCNSEALPIPPSGIYSNQKNISIYPNPATHFISIDNDENVKEISVFNLVGRKLLSFDNVEEGERYDVTSLSSGMYLVRIVDNANKIITTQRISKK